MASAASGAPEPPALVFEGLTGFLREFVDFAEQTAYRPQPFLALAAGIATVGAAAGRRYQTETGLRSNVYVLGIADTGAGKEAARSLMVQCLLDAGLERYAGGSRIASAAAIPMNLKAHPVPAFSMDEIGHSMSLANDKKSDAHKKEIMPMLTELFSKANGIYLGTNYANTRENPQAVIHEPHVVLYGCTVPTVLWTAFNSGMASDGSLPRFLAFASPLSFPDNAETPGPQPIPSAMLDALRAMSRGGRPLGNLPDLPMLSDVASDARTVPFTTGARALLRRLREAELAMLRANEGRQGVLGFWARLGEHVAKLALIAAVSRDQVDPEITEGDMAWAECLVRHCVQYLLDQTREHVADSPYEAEMKKVASFIRTSGRAVTLSEIARAFRRIPTYLRRDILETLVEGGDFGTVETVVEGGKKVRTYWNKAG